MDHLPRHQRLDLNDPGVVCDAFERGAEANTAARCREMSIDRIDADGPSARLIATGDLHDHPVHFIRLLRAAGLDDEPQAPRAHLTLHELIHSDRLHMDMDFSFRQLARVAALKAEYPELVHVLLANHEIAQLTGGLIVKHGVRCVEAFDHAIDHTFYDDSDRVREACDGFIRSMPLALRVRTRIAGEILCAHSLPGPAGMNAFDSTVLSRELTDEDFGRRGAAHLMVWGRGYDHEQLEDLVERWGINMFILGHEHAENGYSVVPPNALVLNSDHEHGVYLPIDLENCPGFDELVGSVVLLGD